jgi:hypothetical protein
MNSSIRQFVIMTFTSLAVLSSGINQAATPVPCPAVPVHAISKKIFIDRTTQLDTADITRLVQFIDTQWIKPSDKIQVLAFGGVTANKIETLATFQVPDYINTPEQRERDRWQKSPAQIALERRCALEARQALRLSERLTTMLTTYPTGNQDRSPIVEGLHAGLVGWSVTAAREIILVSDGVEHYESGRSFYGAFPNPTEWIGGLRAEGLLPSLKGVKVYHLAIGLSEQSLNGTPRNLRKFKDTLTLKALWLEYWTNAGANVKFGEPLITDW